MNPQKLESNQELFEYLVWLSNELRMKQQDELARHLTHASRFASGSPSEFFHEAQLALCEVRDSASAALSPETIADLRSVIAQLSGSFKKIGGA